jgi:integrase-like protein
MTALRQQMTDDMVLRRLSAGTQKAYLRVVTRLAAFYGRSPDRTSEREIQTFAGSQYELAWKRPRRAAAAQIRARLADPVLRPGDRPAA